MSGDKSVPASRPSRPPAVRRVYRKNQPLFALIGKMKLWPSRRGFLHGILRIEFFGELCTITTHCGKNFTVRNSRNSRAGRWLRNKIVATPCPECAVPEWKIQKYQGTSFKKNSGSILNPSAETAGTPERSRRA